MRNAARLRGWFRASPGIVAGGAILAFIGELFLSGVTGFSLAIARQVAHRPISRGSG
ncbi:hypothetical protein GCM10023193_61110 [Planotetraspora kaengkrachanensis]|uniref:Uncharacterized protein n=1 Tax=Planotetraspora kaengkrachanensis TaxID=575193 RepID=A0A8J3PX20_9ACTN|nr:hypothetical protein Pka01_56790 [Planotetraspora kaengkrachanensis]